MSPVFRTLELEIAHGVAKLWLSRSAKSNAFNGEMWTELPQALEYLDQSKDVRVVVIAGRGKNFCGGIDVGFLATLFNSTSSSSSSSSSTSSSSSSSSSSCPGFQRHELRRDILKMQDALTAVEQCRWPVVAAIHGACVGAGVDLAAACDIRYCSHDAAICVKEVDLAIAADLGTLQRLPRIIGHGAAAELALTARELGGWEALQLGLVSRCLPDQAALMAAVQQLAASLAAKPQLALVGTKRVLLHARDHNVPEGLEYVATWNSAMLITQEMGQLMAPLLARHQQRNQEQAGQQQMGRQVKQQQNPRSKL